MNQENKEVYLLQANKISKEVLDYFSEDLFIKTEIKEFDNLVPDSTYDSELQASAFFLIIAREQLQEELEKNKESAFISNALFENNKIIFFLIHYNPQKERLVQKYKVFCDYLQTALFDFLQEEWKKENFYFYNSSISGIITHNAIETMITEVSKKCCGYEEIALYENINLSLFNILSELSYTTYEKSNSEGLIYFTNTPYEADFQFKFDNYEDFGFFSLNNMKLIRKLLELTSVKKGIGIITDSNRIYGIGTLKEGLLNYNVVFEEDHKWILSKNETELLTMKDNSILFFNSKLSSGDFNTYIRNIFPEIADSDNSSNIYNIIKTLIKQQKGTILVVMKNAEKYINRYRDLAMVIEPVKLDEKNVEKLSSIDGAIIMDENSMCYGFGVVLDGIDTGSGNRARGSRYNSSERFYNYCKNKNNADLFVFILSDDGNFNFFPQL